MTLQRIGIIGGSGFVGRYLVAELTRRRYHTRVVTRRRERHRDLLVCPTCQMVEADPHDRGALTAALAGCDAVVNLVGILNTGTDDRESFHAAHVGVVENAVAACRANGIDRLVHMGALNASGAGPSEYLKTKQAGEDAAHAAEQHGIGVTTLRPSVIFGHGDGLFTRFATLLRLTPGVFPLASPDARMAPVFVEDVATAFVRCLEDPGTAGHRYDLCGPSVYSLREIVEYTAAVIGVRCRVVGLGRGLANLQASVLELVPGKPLSRDNLLSLQVDSVCRGDDGLRALGITATSVESVVPGYLGARARQFQYGRFRAAARRDG
ncbi:MAG: complex I NDUFA9 subunit family protein [Ectothiorhodospiraceae bacterium]|nr:complex I NDUFA9 subunit family protein [Chromatiales bacterium]MCP5157346.1 complex I NDUFA9 subunit family protein [Ectothiorhodospiraceae bacterium]